LDDEEESKENGDGLGGHPLLVRLAGKA